MAAEIVDGDGENNNKSMIYANVNSGPKLSHKQWKAAKKKMKRKEKRQHQAQLRDEGFAGEESESELAKEQVTCNDDDERERQRQHELWLEKERMAQAAFLAKKDREEKERLRLEEEQRMIKEEFEKLKAKEAEEAEKRKKENEEKKMHKDKLLKEATANVRKQGEDGAWHNPIAPAGYSADNTRPVCDFYRKVGACRFKDQCSRSHDIPLEDSCTLLFPGMYSHFELEQRWRDEYDTDLTLEFEDTELRQHFEVFYSDVLPEFKAVGRVVQFKVCCNYEPHLRGNVYVQYSSHDEAMKAFEAFNGRWYAGRLLSCQFTCVTRWKQAICGVFHQHTCPKGPHCNYLHVFRNPFNEFRDADFDNFHPAPSPRQPGNGSQRMSNGSQRRRSPPHSVRSYRSLYSQNGHFGSRSRSRSRQHDRDSVRRTRNISRSRSRSPSSSRHSSRKHRRSVSPSRSSHRQSKHSSRHVNSPRLSHQSSKRRHSRSPSRSPELRRGEDILLANGVTVSPRSTALSEVPNTDRVVSVSDPAPSVVSPSDRPPCSSASPARIASRSRCSR